MSTPSEVSTGLDNIALVITSARAVLAKCKLNAQGAIDDLNALPDAYAGLLDTVGKYAKDDAAEAYAKAQLAKLTAEFQALLGELQTVTGA